MVDFAPREVGPGQIAISAGWTICEVVPIPELHLASHPEMAPPTHPSLPAPQPSPVQALSKSRPSTKKSPMAALFPKGPQKACLSYLQPLCCPRPICSPISCRKRDTVRGLGRGKRLWLDKPKLHECCRQAFLRQSETAGEVKCHWVCSKMCLSGVETRRVSRPLTTKGGMASLAAMKLLMPQDKLTKLARRAGRERRSVLISAAGITTPPPPTPPALPAASRLVRGRHPRQGFAIKTYDRSNSPYL